jgi:predicted component of viral defense system (DUF524 family)
MIRLAAIRVSLADGIRLLLAPDSEDAPEENMTSLPFLPAGWEGKVGDDSSAILYDPSASRNGMHPLGLVEVVSFHWELQKDSNISADHFSLRSSLSGSSVRNRWHARRTSGRLCGDFSFTVYLGSAWIELLHQGRPLGQRLRFEVITKKMDYAREYRAMVETIGSRCSQLLLDWGAPTAIKIALDPGNSVQTLLEQFLFLRHVLGPERLDLYLETLSRRPHSTLHRERVWQPAAFASPAAFIRDPLRFGRRWREALDDEGMIAGFTADEILMERKYESLDTPPNRFVKFALQTFRGICEDVIHASICNPDTRETVVLNEERGAAWQEAFQMRDTLDACLATPFFAEIGSLLRIPIESQALQKREGYRDILHAWLMLEVAAQIDWPGRSDAYDGTNRDVATLYEFWLYFVLMDLFQKQLGMTWLRDEASTDSSSLPFCCKRTDGRMRINLKRGVESLCRFRWTHEGQRLLIHFFYNREFHEEADFRKDGSYSKSFRPDYTVVVLPAEYESKGWRKAEELAEANGTISYLHFDAKYRIDNLKDLFGVAEETDADRKEAKSTGTVKNADLYKMHTYNEAIRRTVGSYVLYPGNDDRPNYEDVGDNRNIYRRYHEIIPGIGAFAVKPKAGNGNDSALGIECVQCFFHDFLIHQLSKFTHHYRLKYWTERIIRAQSPEFAPELLNFHFSAKPPNDTQVLLGFVRSQRSADTCLQTSVFFCHAVEWKADASFEPGAPTDLDFDPFRSELFVAYSQNTSAPWLANILNVRLVTAAECAKERFQPLTEMKAAYYYRFQLGNLQPIARRDIASLVDRRPGKPVAGTLSEFAACPVL